MRKGNCEGRPRARRAKDGELFPGVQARALTPAHSSIRHRFPQTTLLSSGRVAHGKAASLAGEKVRER